jgi:hypothetical protein
MNNLWSRYCAAAVTYGLCRKVVMTHGATIETRHPKTYAMIKVPMLTTQRVVTCFAGGAVNAAYMPAYIVYDLMRLELAVRGVDPETYGTEFEPVGSHHCLNPEQNTVTVGALCKRRRCLRGRRGPERRTCGRPPSRGL